MKLLRVTDQESFDRVEPVLREYVSWVFDGVQEHFGVRFAERDAAVEARHAEFRSTFPSLLVGRGRLVLATVAGVPAGVGALKPVDADVGEVKRMFVRPEARGTGVARAMLERLLADARREGFRTVQLETFTFMRPALALYRSFGFVAVEAFAGSETATVGLRDRTCYLRLDLTRPAPDADAAVDRRVRPTPP